MADQEFQDGEGKTVSLEVRAYLDRQARKDRTAVVEQTEIMAYPVCILDLLLVELSFKSNFHVVEIQGFMCSVLEACVTRIGSSIRLQAATAPL